jgi:hypothetical protein
MKNCIVSSLIALVLLFAADKGFAQCPAFTHPVYTYEIDQFNFHRPKYDCGKGFFICIRGHWDIRCAPNSLFSARITEEGMVQFYALLKDKQIELHLPAALAELPQYAEDDMSVFSVEKDWISVSFEGSRIGAMKEGDYTVRRVKDELVVTIDLE